MDIGVAIAVMGGTGLLCAGLLVAGARLFAVAEDPRLEAVAAALPGINCGGCGFGGCADYAQAVVRGGAAANLCGPGGADAARRVASILGVAAAMPEPHVAIVLCGGDDARAARTFRYNGVADCAAAGLVGGGGKRCGYGCLGYGNCARVCPTRAIEITARQLAVVHPALCIACGRCVRACPRKLVQLVPARRAIHVLCRSRDRAAVVRQACSVGCIACTVCTRLADNEAIRMDGALAVVDYTRDLANRDVIAKCPGACIVHRPGTPARAEGAAA